MRSIEISHKIYKSAAKFALLSLYYGKLYENLANDAGLLFDCAADGAEMDAEGIGRILLAFGKEGLKLELLAQGFAVR